MFDFKKNNNTKILEHKDIEVDINSINLEYKKAESELSRIKKLLNDTKVSVNMEINNLNKKVNYYRNELNKIENIYYEKNFNFSVDCFNSLEEMDFELQLENTKNNRKDLIKQNKAFKYENSVCVVKDLDFEKIIFRGLSNEFEIIKNEILKQNSNNYIDKFNDMINFYCQMCNKKYFEITNEFIDTYKNEIEIYKSYCIFKEKELLKIKDEIKQDKRKKEIRSIRNKFSKNMERSLKNKQAYERKILNERNNVKKSEFENRLIKIENHINYLKEKEKYIEYQENKIKSGYMYILSNVLSFGKDIFKICVTDSLFPFREIVKLNQVSTPYEYELRYLYIVDDVEQISKEILVNFKNRIVRRINDNDNFFRCSKNEIEKFIEKMNQDKFIKVK